MDHAAPLHLPKHVVRQGVPIADGVGGLVIVPGPGRQVKILGKIRHTLGAPIDIPGIDLEYGQMQVHAVGTHRLKRPPVGGLAVVQHQKHAQIRGHGREGMAVTFDNAQLHQGRHGEIPVQSPSFGAVKNIPGRSNELLVHSGIVNDGKPVFQNPLKLGIHVHHGVGNALVPNGGNGGRIGINPQLPGGTGAGKIRGIKHAPWSRGLDQAGRLHHGIGMEKVRGRACQKFIPGKFQFTGKIAPIPLVDEIHLFLGQAGRAVCGQGLSIFIHLDPVIKTNPSLGRSPDQGLGNIPLDGGHLTLFHRRLGKAIAAVAVPGDDLLAGPVPVTPAHRVIRSQGAGPFAAELIHLDQALAHGNRAQGNPGIRHGIIKCRAESLGKIGIIGPVPASDITPHKANPGQAVPIGHNAVGDQQFDQLTRAHAPHLEGGAMAHNLDPTVAVQGHGSPGFIVEHAPHQTEQPTLFRVFVHEQTGGLGGHRIVPQLEDPLGGIGHGGGIDLVAPPCRQPGMGRG